MPREGDRRPRSLTDWLGLTDAPRWGVARPLGVGLAVALALLFVLALVVTVAVLVRAVTGGEGGSLGVGALVVALLGAPFLIWSTVIKHETLRYQKEGHITDRIAKAVEQLGAEKTVKTAGQEESRPNIEVRIGAILALERIAQDSTRLDRGRDHVRVMEILCAYVRENAPAGRAAELPADIVQDEPAPTTAPAARNRNLGLAKSGGLTDARNRAWRLPMPRADIAMAISVIGRRSPEQKEVEAQWNATGAQHQLWPFSRRPPSPPESGVLDADGEDASRELDALRCAVTGYKESLAYSGYRIDLRACNLQRVDFRRGDFSAADFTDCRLEGADFRGARLVSTQLGWARLDGSLFNYAVMPCASLRDASIEGTDFTAATMHDVTLSNISNARDARFAYAELIGAVMVHGRLEHTLFYHARLECGYFEGVTFIEPFFSAAGLSGAKVRNTLIQGGAITNTSRVRRTHFAYAAFRQIDLTWAPIEEEALVWTFGDASVTLPAGVRSGHPGWPAHWPVWTLPDQSQGGGPDFDGEWCKWAENGGGYTPPPPPRSSQS